MILLHKTLQNFLICLLLSFIRSLRAVILNVITGRGYTFAQEYESGQETGGHNYSSHPGRLCHCETCSWPSTRELSIQGKFIPHKLLKDLYEKLKAALKDLGMTGKNLTHSVIKTDLQTWIIAGNVYSPLSFLIYLLFYDALKIIPGF